MRYVFTILLIFVCCFSITLSEINKQVSLEELRQEVLYYTNEFRKNNGLKELKLRYSIVAQKHASDQAECDQYLAHRGFNKRADDIMDYLKQEPDMKKRTFELITISENCCYFPICLDPAKKAFQQFISSPTHRHNLLKHCHYTAIGIDQSKSGYFYFCQLFF